MLSILADLCIGFFEFVRDVLLLRRLRSKHDRRGRSIAEDAAEVARFDVVTLAPIALVCVALMLLLAFAGSVPVGWSVGIGIAVGTIWALGGTPSWCESNECIACPVPQEATT